MTTKEIFLIPNEERNFALIIDNKKLWVSKEVLSMQSPVFKKLFYEDTTAKNENFLELPNKSFEEVSELMACLFSYPSLKSVDEKNVCILLKFAQVYQIENLKNRCSNFLMEKLMKMPPGSIQCMPILQRSIQYYFPNLINLCIPRVASSMSVSQIRQYRNILPDYITLAIFEAKSNRLENELNNRHYCISYSNSKRKCISCNKKTSSCCKKCSQYFCKLCKNRPCPSFHDSSCSTRMTFDDTHSACLCGYEFDNSFLLTDSSKMVASCIKE